jgi:hypothetical protein
MHLMRTTYALPARVGAGAIATSLLLVTATSFVAAAQRALFDGAHLSQRALHQNAPRPTLVDAPASEVAKAVNVGRPKNVCATAYYGGLEDLAQRGCKTYYNDPTHGYPKCADGK